MTVFDSDLMFLMGAGASIPVSVPGMTGMVREFKAKHGRSDPARKAYEAFIQVGVTDDLEEVLQFCNRLIELREGHVTDVLRDAVGPRAGASVTEFQRRLLAQIETAERLRESLIRWIGDVCLRFDRGEAVAIYGDLVPLLAALEIPVFTTNYDGVLDEVAAVKEVAVADNFVTDGRGRKFWDSTHQAFFSPGLHLVKMHGSIYWHATADNAVIEKIMQPAMRNAEGEAVSQLLIFPTRFKDIYQQNYFPLYTAFTRTLGRATTLILVGHSLRDEYLLAAVRERLKDKTFGLVVVDVALPSALRGLSGRILHLEGSIKQFAPLLCRALSEHHGSNKHFDYLSEAHSAIKRGRKERIDLAGMPTWVSPGQPVEKVILSLGTLLGVYTWDAFVLVNGKRERLRTKPDARPVRGFGTETLTLRFNLPKELERGQRYEVSFVLLDDGGKQVARVARNVRVRKN